MRVFMMMIDDYEMMFFLFFVQSYAAILGFWTSKLACGDTPLVNITMS